MPDVLDSWERVGITPLGVFEAEVIAASPSLIVRGERAASVIVRSWGVLPGATGIHIDRGAGINLGTCDDVLPSTGEVQHGVVTTANQHRSLNGSALFLLDNGALSRADEGLLTATFGPPEIYGVTLAERVQANWLVWWPVLVSLAGAVLLVRRSWPRRRTRTDLRWAWRAARRRIRPGSKSPEHGSDGPA